MSTTIQLVIGNKNYSSWSLRPWILLKHARIRFEEVRIPLFTERGTIMLEELCPAHQVPVLYDGDLVLWDSLAICEYVAEKFPDKRLWPENPQQRATARAMSAEMHSSFATLRSAMPMNCRRVINDVDIDSELQADINRMQHLLTEALNRSGGPWLFGHYTVADAMFAPVASRFHTYQVKPAEPVAQYFKRVLGDMSMQQWYSDAEHEAETISRAEL